MMISLMNCLVCSVPQPEVPTQFSSSLLLNGPMSLGKWVPGQLVYDRTQQRTKLTTDLLAGLAPVQWEGTPAAWSNWTQWTITDGTYFSTGAQFRKFIDATSFYDMFGWVPETTFSGTTTINNKTVNIWELSTPTAFFQYYVSDDGTPVRQVENIFAARLPGTPAIWQNTTMDFMTFEPVAPPSEFSDLNTTAALYPPACPPPEDPTPVVLDMYIFHPSGENNISGQDTADAIGDAGFVCFDVLSNNTKNDNYSVVSLYSVEVYPQFGQYKPCNNYHPPICIGGEPILVGREGGYSFCTLLIVVTNMSLPKRVIVADNVVYSCLTHAETTSGEEIMGFCLGARCNDDTLVWDTCVRPRVDRRSDRVELSDREQIEAQGEAEAQSNTMGVDTRVVGWYHSHPKITCPPSHVDIRTQHSIQKVNVGMGLIFSVFNDQDGRNRVQFHCFQSISDQKAISLPIIVESQTAVFARLNVIPKMIRSPFEGSARILEILAEEEEMAFKSHLKDDPLLQINASSIYTKSLSSIAAGFVYPLAEILDASKDAHQEQEQALSLEIQIESSKLESEQRELEKVSAEEAALEQLLQSLEKDIAMRIRFRNNDLADLQSSPLRDIYES
eukprot:TRINITY_DN983_c0_g1_i8.p1 TRINITY_DN983_c0_g1~~TRINITY_DN983_c0_g1_i8.p1  ORF type:complete len:630 (+),score=122.01 TRINITY_DN983_c0_g1_i8:48-1892(+)